MGQTQNSEEAKGKDTWFSTPSYVSQFGEDENAFRLTKKKKNDKAHFSKEDIYAVNPSEK